MLQYFGVPGVVAACTQCHAVVSIRQSNNLIIDLLLEGAVYVFILALLFWSKNVFGAAWPGVVIGLLLFLGRLYLKASGPLD